MDGKKAKEMLLHLNAWKLIENAGKLEKEFKFGDFKGAVAFVNKVAEVAESEKHHPDIGVRYNRVTLTLYTHKINGLHENDFILAAKIDRCNNRR